MGEAFVRPDLVGKPIQTIATPELQAGLYEFETTNLDEESGSFPADTVLAVRTGGGVDAVTLGGADECSIEPGDNDVRRSCVRVMLSEPKALWIWVWARDQIFQGETDVRYQRLEIDEPVRGSSVCGDWVSEPWGCWKKLATGVPFGGMMLTAEDLGENLDRVARLETTELPGAELVAVPSEHAIMLLDGASPHHLLPSQPYDGSFRGAPYSHQREIAGTAEWTGYLHAARVAAGGHSEHGPQMPLILVGPLGADTGGPYRVMRNDFVEHHVPSGDDWSTIFRGEDWDRDGLGEDLEAILRTCDSPSSPDANTMRCRDLSGCSATAFDTDLCRAACRDSDQDAMRDDYEVFGLATYDGEYVAGMELARYGADPAHFDVMVELDNLCRATSSDRWWHEPPPTCELGLAMDPGGLGFPTPVPGTITAQEYAARATEPDLIAVPPPPPESASDPLCWVYGSRSDFEYFDPEVLAGIAAVYAAIPGFENRSGIDGIALHFDAGIPPVSSHRGIYGDWGGSQLANLLYECNEDTVGEILADYIEPQRRWLFRHAQYHPAVHGGKASVPSLSLLAGGAGGVLAHELGHTGGLNHGGPSGDPRAAENYNPIYRSRVNYLYQNLTVLDERRTEVTFSDGSFPGVLNPLDLDEECPFGEGEHVPSIVLDKLPGC